VYNWLPELTPDVIAPVLALNVPLKLRDPDTAVFIAVCIWSPVAKLLEPRATVAILAATVGAVAVPPIVIVFASPVATLVTPWADPVIVISVAEVCVNVMPVPSVKLTTESEPVAASKFKGTLDPDLDPALNV